MTDWKPPFCLGNLDLEGDHLEIAANSDFKSCFLREPMAGFPGCLDGRKQHSHRMGRRSFW